MEIEELKNSGDLEAYVCGALTLEESRTISKLVEEHEELQIEVQYIEDVLFRLAAGIAPNFDEVEIYENLRRYVKEHSPQNDEVSWSQYLGWAAAILLFVGAGFLYHERTELNEQIVDIERTNTFLNNELEQLDELNADYQEALAFIKNKNTVKVNLAGQGNHINANAVAFHNPQLDKTYVDISGLPDAPANMTYQLWSLTLNPLTPTNLGIVALNDKELIMFNNGFETEAFGITLEDAGGSDTPTLERLYTLGAIN